MAPTDQRWYMFQNMGPAPSARSGHAMATAGSKVFVIGGEGLATGESDDPDLIHALETRKFKDNYFMCVIRCEFEWRILSAS